MYDIRGAHIGYHEDSSAYGNPYIQKQYLKKLEYAK